MSDWDDVDKIELSREKYPKLYDTPIPKGWIGSEVNLNDPSFTGISVQKDLPTGDFRTPPPVDQCPNVYMEGKPIIQIYTPSGWININAGYPERVFDDVELTAISIDDQPGPGHGEIISIREKADKTYPTDHSDGDEPHFVELTGDDIPYHLRPYSKPLGMCDRCGREVWNAEEIDTVDTMIQPDGKGCGGMLRREPIIWPDKIDFEPEDY